MKKIFSEFKKFISRGNVVDMAVGVAVASAFTAIVNAFSKGFISPLIAMFTDASDLASMKWVLRPELIDAAGETVQTEVAILWGSILQAVIDFLIIALTMFLVLRIFVQLSKRATEIREDLKKKLRAEEVAKEAEEKKKKEEEERAQALAAEEAARIEAERVAAEEARLADEKRLDEERRREELALLREIRDLLKKEKQA